MRIRIEATKEAAKKHHDETQAHLDATTMTFYTDGSGIEDRIGAAAYNAVAKEASHQHLGSEMQFNVYTAELTALQLAIKQLGNHSEYRTCRIYIDSQAAIKAIDRPRRQSGQSIIKDILDSINEVTSEHTHLQFEIIWIPGHTEIEGNERAGTEAKKAAMDPILNQSHKYKPLKSARVRYIKTTAKKKWQTIWSNNTKTATALRRIIKEKYAKTGPSLYNEIANRNEAAVIAQLRTGHCGLNRYLH